MPRPEFDLSASDDSMRAAPRGGTVDVLGDVVELYLRSPSHERGEIRAFADLVDGLLDGAGPGERRRVALALAPRADTPPSIARRLAKDCIEVAEAMIEQSPVLTSRDLVDVMRCGPAHVRCVGRRLDLAPDIAAVLVDNSMPSPSPAAERAGQRRRGDRPSEATTPAAPRSTAPSADARREAPAPVETPLAATPFFRVPLRESAPAAVASRTEAADDARPGTTALPSGYAYLVLDSAARWRALQAAALEAATRTTPSPSRGQDATLVGERLLAAAIAGDRAFFVTALAEALDLAPALVEAIVEEPSGEALAVLLVAAGIGEIRATSVLLHHLGARATLGSLQDLAALVGRTSRRAADRLVAAWGEEMPSRHTEVRRQTDPAVRREAAGAAREGRTESRRPGDALAKPA